MSSFLSLSNSYLPPKPTSTSSQHRQQLLSSCKTFWKVVETIERDLPTSELDAVRKSWKDVVGLLEDCETEIKELVEEGEEEEEEEEEEKEELSEDTKSIILNSHTLLRLSRLLINRLLSLTNSTTPPSSPLPRKFNSFDFLSNLTVLIKRISEKADDLAGVIEDDDEEIVKNVLNEIVITGESLAGEIQEAFEEEEEQGEGKEDDRKEKGNSKVGEWLKVWRGQRDKANESILAALR